MVDTVIVVKIAAIVVTFVLTILFGLGPAWFVSARSQRYKQRGRTPALLSCFAGGVFLATCLLDLIPDVEEELNLALAGSHLSYPGFPLPLFVVAMGLFMVLTVEQVALQYHHRPLQARRNGAHVALETPVSLINEEEDVNAMEMGEMHAETTEPDQSDDHEHLHASLRSWSLLLAISLHSVFEGIAVGLQKETSAVLQLMTAVALHKSVMAFSLGMALVQSSMGRTTTVGLSIFFAITAPTGMAIGMAVESSSQSSHHHGVSGVLTGLATGTFLYVTFLEVLAHELKSNRDRLLKLAAILLGFFTVVGLMFLDADMKEGRYVCPEQFQNLTFATDAELVQTP
ncbi:zinc transporter ZIP1-like [Branchiostoma floridae x Branchiostoma belcheri]